MARRTFHPSKSASFKRAVCKRTCSLSHEPDRVLAALRVAIRTFHNPLLTSLRIESMLP